MQNTTTKTLKIRLGEFLLFTFIFISGIFNANAITYFSRASAAWDVNTTWSTVSFVSSTNIGTFPIAGDVVNIGGGFTVTIGANAACATLVIDDPTTLSSLSVGGFTLTVSGTTTIGGGVTGSNLTITNATGTKTFTGVVTINAGASLSETAAAQLSFGNNVTITGTLTENGAAVVGIAGNLLNNGTYTASKGVHTLSGASKTVGGSSTNTIPQVTVTGTIITNNGTLTINTALAGATGSLTNSNVLNLGGTCSIGTASGGITNSGTINRSGVGTTTTLLANFTNTGTININGSGAITGITNNAAGIVNHSGSSAVTSFNNATATKTLNISTTPTVPAFGTLTVSTAGNTVNYNGSGAQTVKPVTYDNLIFSGSGAKTIGSAISIGGDLSISGGASANFTGSSTNTLSLGGTGTVSGTWGGTGSGAAHINATFFSGGSIITVTNSSGPLPVKLISFTVSPISDGNLLNWVTSTEINNEKFEIERSVNGIDFIKVGQVDGSGNSNQIIKYSFIDRDAETRTLVSVYYRLKQIDFNGKSDYSDIIKVSKINLLEVAKPIVSPNPFLNQIQIVLPNSSSDFVNLKITSMNGVSVLETSVLVGKSNNIDVNTEILNPGIYILSVNNNGIVTNYKVLKK